MTSERIQQLLDLVVKERAHYTGPSGLGRTADVRFEIQIDELQEVLTLASRSLSHDPLAGSYSEDSAQSMSSEATS